MARFSAERSQLGDQPIVVLADDAGHCARIALHGAALLNLEVPRHGVPFDIAWGYHSGAEILARAGSHFAILAPFGGRVANARYTFDGRNHDLAPGAVGDAREFRHGFVRDAAFAIASIAVADDSAAVTLATSAIRPRPGYPFAIDLAVEFTLDADGLSLAADMHNVGEHAAPCFFGWHAYLRVGDGAIDNWELTLPACDTIATDARLIPLPGDAAYQPLDQVPALDFRTSRRVGATVLDTGYAHLAPATDGHLRTRLADPDSGFAISVWQERGIVHAFTGDSLGTGARSAVALEPMECMADAFNRAEWSAAIRLEAGATRVFRCGVEWPAA